MTGVNVFQTNSASCQLLEVSTSLISGPSTVIDFKQASYVSGSFVGDGKRLVFVTASYIDPNFQTTASFAISASWAPGGQGTGLSTGSTYPFTSSFAVSASFAPPEFVFSSSLVTQLGNKQNNISTGSTLPITASWTNNVPFIAGTMSTGSTYPITSSVSVTASFWDSSSIVNTLSTKQNNLSTGSTIPVTSSWATNTVNAAFVAGTMSTGSTYPITSSQAVSSSYSLSSSWAPGGQGGGLETGSTYPFTASWANNVVSASYALSASFAPSSLPSTAQFTNLTASDALLIGPSTDSTACLYVSCSAAHGSIIEIDRFDGLEVLNLSNSGSLSIGTQTLTAGNPETLKVNSVTVGSFNIATLIGNVNNYLQLNLTNSNAGASSSADLVTTNNIGNEFSYFANMGINGSNYTKSYIGGPNDAYFYTTGSDLFIGNAGPNMDLYLFAGGTTNTGSIRITSNFISSSIPISASLIGTASQALTASNVDGFATNNQFSRGGTLYNGSFIPNSIIWLSIWRAPFICTASAFNAIASGIRSADSASVNARRNGNLLLTASYSITGSGVYQNLTALQNQNFSTGDELEIGFLGTTGSISQINIQVDLTR